MSALQPQDSETLRHQLSREPRGVKAIASRCGFGCPQVIESDSLVDGKPFPTLYWLTCPQKIKNISKLEGQNWAERIKTLLAESPELTERLEQAHRDYRNRRPQGRQYDIPALATGIGGVHDTEGIKCLHAHYAHYLATGANPIGELVHNTLQEVAGYKAGAAR